MTLEELDGRIEDAKAELAALLAEIDQTKAELGGIGDELARNDLLSSADCLVLADVRELCRSGGARLIRLDNDLTVVEVARAVGVTHPTISGWETGRFRPTGERARRYAELLNRLADRSVTVQRLRNAA